MFKLPPNFSSIDCELLSFREFKKLSYSLQVNNLKIETIDYHYPNNYYQTVLEGGSDKFSFLQNCYIKYACFRSVDNENIYYDKPDLAQIVKNSDPSIILLDSKILNTVVTRQHLSELSKEEVKEMERWLPSTIGKLMFSCFFD